MAEEADATAPRKRVRSGCLTCRSRRRKCDEGKPSCSNCDNKNLKCRYGVNITFVQSKFQQFQALGQHGEATHLDTSRPQPPTPSRRSYSSSGQIFQGEGNADFVEPELESARHHEVAQSPRTPSQPPSHRNSSWPGSVKPREDPGLDRQETVTSSTTVKRDQYETELLTFYRYNVAPILDLGLGSLVFGIRTVRDTTQSEALYHAALALTSSRRGAVLPDMRLVDEATSVSCAHFAIQAIETLHHTGSRIAHILLICRSLLSAPIELWSSLTTEIAQMAQYTYDEPEEWILLARLHLSTVLSAAVSGTVESLPPLNPTIEIQSEPVDQLCHALRIVEQNLFYLNHDAHQSKVVNSPVHDWLSRWKDVQNWYAARSEDIRQLFELSDADTDDSEIRDQLSFPCVVFSSACAVVANVAHHVAALILLQNKPRLAKATADHKSSTSSLWHAQHVLGIIISAAEAEVWDCFLVAALLYAAQALSYTKQVHAAADALARLSTMSGLQLASAIEHLRSPGEYD